MIYNRSKQSRSETPTRTIHALSRVTPTLGAYKKSDPFLKQLKEVYDKENINPNVKDNRTKSYHLKPDNTNVAENRSPMKKVMNLKNMHKNANNLVPVQKMQKESEILNEYPKFTQSIQFKHPNKSRSSNRKSTEKDEPQTTTHFQDEYYPSKQQKREKKMKVTLKDIKRLRRPIHESDGEYLSKHGDTRESISQQSMMNVDYIRSQYTKNQNVIEQFCPQSSEELKSDNKNREFYCLNHPEKRATHQLIDSVSSEEQNFCEKCALDLATKGHQLSQIFCSNRLTTRKFDVRQERIAELKDFLFELDKMQPVFKQTSRKMQNHRLFLIGKFDEEQKKLDAFFNKILNVVQSSYNTSHTSLKLYQNAIIEELESHMGIVEETFREFSTIKEDIIPNINSIIEETQVQEQSFKMVIDFHYLKLRQVEASMKNISKYAYGFYQFTFDNYEPLLANLHKAITPAIQKLQLNCTFETQRKNTINDEEKCFDPFRMSFGKNNASAYRH